MNKNLICIITLICLLLGGCSYGKDVDEQSFVIAVGIDKGESFPLRVTFVFANPSGSGSGGGGSEGGGESGGGGGSGGSDGGGESKSSSSGPDIVTIEAPTTFSAARKLDAIKSKKINLTHTKLVVFSTDVAKEGIKRYVNGFASSRDFRPNTYVCITSTSAQEYFNSVKPSQEKYLEKYYDHIMQKVASDKVNESYLYYLYFNLTDTYSSSIVPLVGLSKNKLTGPAQSLHPHSDDFSYEARAGELLRDSSNKAEILGCGVFRNDKLITTLGSFQTDLARLIGNEFYPKNYSIFYPEVSDFVTVRIIQQEKVNIKSEIKNDNAHITIDVPIFIEYVDAGEIENDSKKSRDFCNYLKMRLDASTKKLIYDFQTMYDCDFLGLGDSLKKHFSNLSQWKNFNWEEKYSDAKINVSFRVTYADFEETN